jgi:hypothetical protein
VLQPRKTLAQAGVTDGSWLVAEFATGPAASVTALALAPALASLRVTISEAPSSFAQPAVWSRYQFPAVGEPAFACFRPFVGPPTALPASLVSPVFGQFIEDSEQGLPELGNCTVESACLLRLLGTMPLCHRKEKTLQDSVNAILSDFLGSQLRTFKPDQESSDSSTDGGLFTKVGDEEVLLALVEYKRDAFHTSGDPHFQMLREVQQYWQAREESALYRCDSCPVLLIEVAGPLIRISGAAMLLANRVQSEPLTPYLHILHMRDQPRYMTRMLAALRALKLAVLGLRAHYAQACKAASLSASGERDPRIALPYLLRDGTRFTECSVLCKEKLLYTVLDGSRGGERVCVKFCRHAYGSDVHAAWAVAGHAPALHEVVLLPGGLTLVVMELLPRTHNWRMLSDSMPPEAWAAARAALQVVHAAKLPGAGGHGVHGDCRPNNVLLRQRPSSGGYDVRFVDFDGAGVEGVRTYPPFMNPSVEWPAGAVAGEPLRQEHDTALLDSRGGRSL